MLRSMMYVITGSGWSRRLTVSASMPSSSRSPSRSRATPSSRETRSPASTFFATVSGMAMEVELRDPGDEREGVGPPVELAEARRLVLPQAKHDVRAQVRLVARGLALSTRGVRGRDRADRVQALGERTLEARHVLGRHRTAGPGPERKDEGKAG